MRTSIFLSFPTIKALESSECQGSDGGPGYSPEEKHMENTEKTTDKDEISMLINHLLDVMQNAEIHKDFSFNGVSCQRYTNDSFNVTFSFKGK